MYKLLCIDMDGTLLNSRKKISTRAKEAIKKAHDRGVHIVITTGRIYSNAAYYSSLVGVKSPVIAGNGAIVREKDSDEIIYKSALPQATIDSILEICSKYQVNLNFHTMEEIYSGSKILRTFYKLMFKSTMKTNYKTTIHYTAVHQWKSILQKHSGEVLKCEAYALNRKRVMAAKLHLERLNTMEIVSTGKFSFDITVRGVSKGSAVKFLAEYYGIKREEVMVIGDGENDLTMILYAGLGVAMRNAVDLVKRNADFITDSNDEDGVAKAIEKFILI